MFGNLRQVIQLACMNTRLCYALIALNKYLQRSACHMTHMFVCVQLGTRFGIHVTLEKWYRQYGPCYKFFLGRAPVVVVTGASEVYHWHQLQQNEDVLSQSV